MLVRGFWALFAAGIVAVSSSLAGVAQGATLSLVSAPGARLDIRIYNQPYGNLQQISVDLSTRLGGSLALEPLGSFHAVGLEVFLEGDPIVVTSTIPGLALPLTFRVDEVIWTAPIATQPPRAPQHRRRRDGRLLHHLCLQLGRQSEARRPVSDPVH